MSGVVVLLKILLCIYRSQTAPEVTRTLVSMNESSIEMSLSASVSLAYPQSINNGNWHYVALSLEDDKVTVCSDGTIRESYTFAPDMPV